MKTSPSGLARETICPASALLPHTDTVASAPAMRGTAIHAFLCAVGSGMGRDLAASAVPEEWRETVERIEIPAGLDPKAGVPEISLAWHVETGATRELGRGGTLTREQVRALARDGEMVGTVDWLCLDEASVHVRDWKSGWSKVDRAEVNAQLAAYAVTAARHFKRDRAHVSITRLLDSGDSWSDSATLDALDLDAAEADIRAHVAAQAERAETFRSTGALPPLVEGPQCRWCRAFAHCPAKGQLARAALTDVQGDVPRLLAALPVPLTPEAAGELWGKIEQATTVLDAMRGHIREMAQRAPIPLGGGKVLAEVTKTSSKIDPARLRAIVSPEFFESVCERKEVATKTRIEAALKAGLKPGEKLAPVKRAFFNEAEKVGALVESSWRTVEEVAADSPRLVGGSDSVLRAP